MVYVARLGMLAALPILVAVSVAVGVRASSEPDAPSAAAQYSQTAGRPPAYATLEAPPATASAFHRSIAARYNYHFGQQSPFLPSNATTADGQFLDPRQVPTAEYCGHCHKETLHQWRQSVHANAFRAPWYLKNVNALIAEKGVQFSRHCEGCHNPVALFSGDLSQGMPSKRPFEQEGISCAVCHSIQESNTTGTGSYVLGTPAVLVDEAGKPITRPVPDSEILAHLDRHSKAVMRPFYKSAEFCSSCHKAAVPQSLDDYKWLRAISLYDEWQAASFVKQSPLPFYRKEAVSTCQSCHMGREPLPAGSIDPGAKDGALAGHRWPGGNTLVPTYYRYDEQLQRVTDYLKKGFDGKGVLAVDIFALEPENAPENAPLLAPLGPTPVRLAAGQTLVADVVIQNKGIAHSFVPEQRDFYEAWVDFAVKDATGKILFESGFLRPDGSLDPSAHSFTSRLINDQGTLNDLHQIWHNRVLAYNNVLQSGRSELARYRFRLPKTIKSGFSLTATVRYRRFKQNYIDYAMDAKHYPQPIVEVALQTRSFQLGLNPPAAPIEGENPVWMRWNNYGIALLDAQQYPASVAAFQRVAQLRPDYADAYTNQAIVQLAWQHYDEARANLARALTLLPGDPRALYYRALVERNAGSPDQAIADLEAVVLAYPRFKDGLRELGFSYYQRHDYARATQLYQRLQAVDPDDLAAHYQLAILYRRLGQKNKAALENAKFADQKDDPSASVYALKFLGNHPETAAESVPWHLHDLTGDPVKPPAKIEYTYISGTGM